ncbi:CbtB-domain containing protein [Frankia sp. CNm7]|uniref:CbtB-domain containing protein n=1 Tax=Frankia nepalensis TaxID=1836974 RepID=A0A937RL06_9ACTN|nr:CbtB-domain containing protein [Frankia nepalensis]MBL7499800.1 CbtB-domain containing protein [Frankia nepalensis]MBL7515903.1 CbtB-domain containing protein [Frankia nepalensis]MBL7519254.1 CbtB-domain containing protein [Frankia nepalensis]MBL7628358.1 CbtB-domain containing protein [Frankia nepalensis]
MSIAPGTHAADRPAPLSVPATFLWTALMVVAGLAVYYFVGIDQGMVSIFGSDTHIHEFVHDARHFLGFPCH